MSKAEVSQRSVVKWCTVLYLYQSVCQSGTLLQQNPGEEQEGEKQVMKMVKEEEEKQWETREDEPQKRKQM